MRSAFCNEAFENCSVEQACAAIAAAGYEAVELAPMTLAEDASQLTPRERQAIRAAAERAGLAIAGLHWLLVKPAGLHLTIPDAAVRKQTVAFLEELIQLCAELGGEILVWGSPKQRSIAPEQEVGQVRQWVVETLVRLAAQAHQHGVTFCIEPLSRDQTNFINTPDEAAELVREAGSPPGLGIILDAYSSNQDGIDIVAQLRRHFALVQHIHVNDTNKQGPGMGTYDFGPLIATARELGYQGYISVEPFDYQPGADRIARVSRDYLRSKGL